MRNRCTHLDRDARHGGEFLSDLGEHFFLVAAGQFEGGFYFRRVHAERVLIEFRPSRFASHGLYFRHGEQQAFHPLAYLVGLLQRYAGQRGDVDGE